ncbi:MAG: outer membrane beta-barrel protein [Bacteroidetes bacterium]|nr:outer membrane beta-barrel protein [Bacteroidota bacterium]
MKKKYIILPLMILILLNQRVFSADFLNDFRTPKQNDLLCYYPPNLLNQKNVYGPKIGICMAGFTNYGLQGYSFKPSYGLMALFRISKSIGLHFEINYTRMGTRDTLIPIPLGVKKGGKNDEKESDDLVKMAKGGLETIQNRLVFKKEENTTLYYITIPLHISLIFKSHNNSFITNFFLFGAQLGFLLDAETKRYAKPSVLLNSSDVEEVYWQWASATKCEGCEQDLNIKDKANSFDYGFSFGYMFETLTGFLFGIKYYEGLRKIYTVDDNVWARQRKNTSIEFFLVYNFARLF